jgi:16S rRNA G966 N2-methylase RsmD
MAKTAVSDWTQHSPITEFIEPFKRKSRVHYGFHGYFTSQPFNVVSQYIGHYSREGELVADPFCGSGVTAVESLRLKRRAFALDLNSFAVLLTQAKCSYVDLEKFKSLYERILSEVTEECEEIESIPEAKSEDLKIPYWYPQKVKLPRDSDVDFLDEIFSKKQLYQLALIKSHIDKIRPCPEKDLLLIQFCGTMRRANKAYSLPDDGRPATAGDFTIFQTGRYRIPKRVVTLPVLPSFINKFNSLVQAKRETNPFFKDFVNEKTLDCEIGSATDLRPYLKSKSVDYIYTDPPYGAHIRYLDLSTVYNAWLKYEISEI